MLFEWKKLMKSKLRMTLMGLLIILPILMIASGVNIFLKNMEFVQIELIETPESGTPYVITKSVDYVIEDGVRYEGLDAVRRADQIQHEYAGSVERLYEVYQNKLAQLSLNEEHIDEQKMITYYGKDWKQYYEQCKRGELSVNAYEELIQGYRDDPIAADSKKQMMRLEDFHLFYTDEIAIERSSLAFLYQPRLEIDPQESYLITEEKVQAMKQYEEQIGSVMGEQMETPKLFYYRSNDSRFDKDTIEYLNTQFLKHPFLQDGTMAYQMMISCMELLAHFLPWMLLLFGAIFIPLFQQEVRCQTDQLLRSVVIGNAKQAISKIGLCSMVMLGYSIIVLFLIWLIPQLLIGYHSLEGFSVWIWSMQEEMIMASVLYLFCMFLYAGLLCLLSAYTAKRLSAYLWYMLCVGIGCMEAFITFPFMTQSFLSYLPGSCFKANAYPFHTFHIFGRWIDQGVVNVIVYGGIAIICMLLAFFHYRKRDIQNA